MSQFHLIGVLVRIFALYVALTTLQLVPGLIGSAKVWEAERWQLVLALAAMGVPLIVSLVLWNFNLVVARRFFYRGAGSDPVDLKGVEGLETALFSLFGLWCVCASIADGAYWLAFFQLAQSPLFPETVLPPEQKGAMAASLVNFIVGLVLLLKSKGITFFLSRIRGNG